ncbi:MAG: aminoglycoside phosphotransferase family protein [Parcubacteria group bacterium]|nr:aminoglycoside phosphotransferase family protein [Parcubacteria group bacterium]
MQRPPSTEDIRQWLRVANPLGMFATTEFSVEDIDPKPWSGHFNFLITLGDKRMVLRFKGPEWGDPKRGTRIEYEVLKYVESWSVAPHPLYVTDDFFGEAMLLEEYLEGKSVGGVGEGLIDDAENIARFLARIGSVPVRKDAPFFEEPMTSYEKNRKAWKARLRVIAEDPQMGVWGKRLVDEMLPSAERMLDAFEPTLKKAIREHGETFIFESAHIGHLFKTNQGFRFLNWEQCSYGDPAFMLAVFLTSIQGRGDHKEVKKKMIEVYPTNIPREEFKVLVEERMRERAVSNLIWGLWTRVRKGDTNSFEDGAANKEFDGVMQILSTY